MENQKQEWYNPKPESIGKIISEIKTDNGRAKTIIVKNGQNNFYMYGYLIDDADLIAGLDIVVGWVSDGPSITDTLENAYKLSDEFLENLK